jgi:hypothetical protein
MTAFWRTELWNLLYSDRDKQRLLFGGWWLELFSPQKILLTELLSEMTIRDAKLELAKLGMVLSKTEYGEFRVNFKGGSEATAYYTNDLEDAIGTGRLMGQQRQVQGSRSESKMDRFAASQTLDRISDHIESLRQEMPREASNLRGMALRLDRIANTLEAEQEASDRVSQVENDLEELGVDFTVEPTSSGKQATCIYAYKGQLDSRDEASVIGRIAKKYGSLFENTQNNRTYKITVPHHV